MHFKPIYIMTAHGESPEKFGPPMFVTGKQYTLTNCIIGMIDSGFIGGEFTDETGRLMHYNHTSCKQDRESQHEGWFKPGSYGTIRRPTLREFAIHNFGVK